MAERPQRNRDVLFFRGKYFYPIELTPQCDIEEHVRLNPGTTKVTDAATGEVLWPHNIDTNATDRAGGGTI